MKNTKNIFTLILVLGFVGFISGACLSFTYAMTKEAIAESEEAARMEAVYAVLPGDEITITEETIMIEGIDHSVFFGYSNGESIGMAVESVAGGYGGDVTFLVGFNPNLTIAGMALLKHAETPGLGAKAGDADFLDQFIGRTAPVNGFKVTKDGGGVDAITAATITSRTACVAATKAARLIQQIKGDQ